jgi:hypothetical protein
MSILNQYVLNRSYPEGSMIEGYSTEKIIECCLGYLKDKIGIGLPVPRFLGRLEGVRIVRRKLSWIRISKVCSKHIIVSCSIS